MGLVITATVRRCTQMKYTHLPQSFYHTGLSVIYCRYTITFEEPVTLVVTLYMFQFF